MQNQISPADAERLRSEFTNMDAVITAIESGNMEVANGVTSGVFKEYDEPQYQEVQHDPIVAELPPEMPEVQEVQEPVVEEIQELPHQKPVDIPTVEDKSEEVLSGVDDDLKRQREAYRQQQKMKDDLQNSFKTELTKFNMEFEEYKSAAEKEKQELLRQLNAVQSQIVDPELESGAVDIDQNYGVNTPKEGEKAVDPRLDKLQSEFDAYRQQQEEFALKQQQREAYEDTVQRYRDFWLSEHGESLKPTGNVKQNIDAFLDFYSDLVKNTGDESYANILMQDIAIRNDKESLGDIEKLGLSVPNEFDKVYKTYALELATEGKEIDPVTGTITETSKRRLGTIEEAYILQNKNAIQDKNSVTEDIRRKLAEKTNSARQIDPSRYAPMPTSSVWDDNDRQMELFKQARNAGYDGTSISSCRNKELQDQLREMFIYTGRLKK